MSIKSIYDVLPIEIQNIMTTLYGYKIKKQRYGTYYYEHLSFLKEFENYTIEEQQKYQFDHLLKLLRFAVDNSAFYKKIYENINIEKDIQSVSDLKKLPIVTKEMLRANIDHIVTIKENDAIMSSTGGTTGKSLSVYFTKRDNQIRMATLDYFKSKHGFLNISMRRATFNGKHIIPQNQKRKVFWRYNAAIKQMIYSSFFINEQNLKYYLQSLNEFRPEAIDGFISSIYEIASYVERNNLKFNFKPIAIFPTSETVTQHHREVIERVFQCKLFDQYASSEGAPFVWECQCNNLHYDVSSGIIENVENSNEILVTSFTSFGTPLIRYQIGDNMKFDSKSKVCQCGSRLPIIQSIQGRTLDYLFAVDGSKIYLGNISNIFKNIPNSVIRARITQNRIDELQVELVVAQNYNDKHSKLITSEIKDKFGKEMNICISKVNEIPREKSGKYKLIINNIKEGVGST